MIKRSLCLLCVLCLLVLSCAAADAPEVRSFDFDLTFSLNTEAFPPLTRSRVQGYADLFARLGLRGNCTWCEATDSFDITGTVFFLDKPDVSVDFHLYGLPYRIWLTSPALGEEIVMFNMSGLLEFALKAQSTLNVQMPYLAFLYPTTTEFPFSGMVRSWKKIVGSFDKSGKITPEQLDAVSGEWDEELQENNYLMLWISALANGSRAPEAVQAEFENLPFYANEYVSGGEPLTVSVAEGSEIWTNAAGRTVFARTETGNTFTWSVTLPATENRYEPVLSFTRKTEGPEITLDLRASYSREPRAGISYEEEAAAALEEDEDETGEYAVPEGEDSAALYDEESEAGYYEESGSGDYSEEGGEEEETYEDETAGWPDSLLDLAVSASGLPASLPCDSAFTVTAVLRGALFPNFAFTLRGNTGTDGSAAVALYKPHTGSGDPVPVFECRGTVVPVDAKNTPDYRKAIYQGAYNLFSLNEEKLGRFKKDITPGVTKTMLDFVSEAPASFVRSILDDLTDIGLVGVLLGQ